MSVESTVTARGTIRYSRLKYDRKGLSSVVTVAGIIAVIMGLVVGPLLTVYIPIKTKEAEAEHMDDVSDSFAALRGNVNKMIDLDRENSQTNVRFELGTDLNNMLMPDSTGTMYLKPDLPGMSIYNSDDNYDLYAKSYGSVEYRSRNHQYTDQRYVYENGAVIVEQGGSSTMDLLPEFDIRKNIDGRTLVNDESIRGNLPGYDTSEPNVVYYNFSKTTSDVRLTYDIYNNNNKIYETDFNTNGDKMPFNQRKSNWYIEHDLDRTNVLAKWTFSEAEAKAYEETEDDLTTRVGTFSGGTTHTTGKLGRGAEAFSGSASRISVPSDSTVDITGPHTIEGWIYPYTISGNQYIISKVKESAAQGYGLMLVNGEIKYILGDYTSFHNLQTSGVGIKAYRWTHVAGTWDGSTMRVYIDGQLKASKDFGGPLVGNSFKLLFGSNQAESGNFFDGRIDTIILSSGAKTSFDLTSGILSVRGGITGDESLAVLDYYERWVQKVNNQDWSYRKKITLKSSQVEEDLINFPVLVSITDTDLKNKASSNGYDIVFTGDDGVTRLDHELESYQSSTGELVAWVEVPELMADTDTDIYMYYGNSAIITSLENPGGVWDKNFKGVWHLPEEMSGTGNSDLYDDSTSNNNDGDDYVSASGQDGKIDSGQQFSGGGDYIEVAHTDGLNIKGPMTISFWIKPTQTTGTFNRIVEKGLWGYQTSYYFGCGDGQNDLTFYLSNNMVFDTANNILSVDSWQHAAVSYDANGNAKLFLNGVQIASGTYTGSITGNTGTLQISFSNSVYDFPGYIDEVRISNIARSTGWIKTGYNNQNDPGNFYSVTVEENIYHTAKYGITKPEALSNVLYFKKITIKSSEVSADLTGFPVLISMTDTSLRDRARSDGYDIYFTDSDGETRLDHEIEDYQSGTGTLRAWVKVPFISSTVDTVIYMYYGESSATDQSNAEGVWTNNYRGVWHLKENPGTTAPQFTDSTSYDNDASQIGSMTSSDQITGKINGGIKFDGIDDRINVPPDTSLDISGDATISGWFKLPSAHSSTSKSRILVEKHISNDYDFTIALAGRDYSYSTITKGSLVMKTENRNTDFDVRYKYTTQTSWNANTWYHFVGVINATNNANNAIYINGVSMSLGNVGGATKADLNFNANFQFGGGNVDTANIATGVNHSDASIDEFRISKSKRTSAWINTEYKNQNNPGNFYTVGAEEVSYQNNSAVVVEVRALTNEYSGNYANAFIVFDYKSDTDYKYAGMRAYSDKWVIGHRTSSGYVQKAYKSETINTNTWYDLKLILFQDRASLYADGNFKLSYTFSQISYGKFGLGNEKAHSHFDDMKIYFNVHNGIQIFINNKYLGLAAATDKFSWDGPYDKFIPREFLNNDKTNVLKFKNVFSPSKIWALRNVKVVSNPREITISTITVACEERSISGSDSHIIHAKLGWFETNRYELGKSNVTLELTTRYHDAWLDFFNSKLNETGTNLNWNPDRTETDFYLWSQRNADETWTIFINIRDVEMLTCKIAVIEIYLD